MEGTAASPSQAVNILSLEDVAARGHRRMLDGWGVGREFHDRAKSVRPEHLATIIYTSGTTGPPKGVMLTHANLVANLVGITSVLDLRHDDTALSFLPLCHAFERIVAYVYLVSGTSMIFAESIDTVARDLLLVRPTLMTGVPRVFEKLEARIASVAKEQGGLKAAIFDWAAGVARARGRAASEGRPRSAWLNSSPRSPIASSFERFGRRLADACATPCPAARRSASARRVFLRGRAARARGLRPHRDGAGVVCDAAGATRVRDRRPAAAQRRVAGRRRWRGAGARAERDVGLLQPARGDVGRARGRLVPHRRHRPSRRGRLPADHRSQEGDARHSGGKKSRRSPSRTRCASHALVGEAVVVGDGRHFPSALLVPDLKLLAARLQADPPDGARGGRGPRRASRCAGALRRGRRDRQREARAIRARSRSSPFSRRSSRWTRVSSRPRSRSNGA